MQRADAEHADVGPERAQSLDSDRADRDLVGLQQAAADEHHLDLRVGGERGRDGRRVGHDRARVGVREAARELERRGATVEHDHARAAEQWQSGVGERHLGLVPQLEPPLERADRLRGGKRASVHAQQQPLVGEFTQVASHRVLGHAEARDELGGDDLAVAVQSPEDLLPALSRQHSCRL